MNESGHDLLAIGSIRKAFGVEGNVIVQQLTDFPSRFQKRKKVLVGRSEKQVRELEIEGAVIRPRGVKMKFRGIDDRNAAEQLVGSFLYVKETERPRLPVGRYYTHDIVGLAVVDEQGIVHGTIREILKMPAHDVYVVSGKGSEILLPAVKEFVLKIDLPSRTMHVRLIEGMVSNEE